MISRIRGTLTNKGVDRIEVMTAGGVGYSLQIPLGTLESLPRAGEAVELHTALVVKEDGWQLFGFSAESDRLLFTTLLAASGVGPALALGLLSGLGATRVVRAIRERDLVTLQTAPRVGKKIAERLCVELGDKMKEFSADTDSGPRSSLDGAAADAVRALVSLGYSQADAERAVRKAMDRKSGSGAATADLVRAGLAELQKR